MNRYIKQLRKRLKKFFLQKIDMSFSNILSVFSLCVTTYFIIGYILLKSFSLDFFKQLFDFPDSLNFIWLFIIFTILCNLSYFKGVIKSLLREKLDEEVLLEIPVLKEEILKDKEFIKTVLREIIKDEVNNKSFVDKNEINK